MRHSKPVVIMTQSRPIESDSDVLSLVHAPLIATEKLPFDREVLGYRYDWLILTSRNAVEHFLPYIETVQFNKLATIGRKTSERLEQEGLQIHFEPRDYSQEGFLSDFPVEEGMRILYPASAQARPLLYDHLVAKGCDVEKFALYQPVANRESKEKISKLLSQSPDAITFSSPSGVRAFMKWFSPEDLGNITVSAIGQVTADALKAHGVHAIQPDKETVEDMVKQLESRIDGGI
ncbi:uroporphyrinogen-III synthase [Salinicoccus sesuvii]|uniref:Uroporphyrinogen-III synthase n=1 Tax=Salinicoccus sesuvii TaxID=868281 RepID=A0ABV7N653_9STAP